MLLTKKHLLFAVIVSVMLAFSSNASALNLWASDSFTGSYSKIFELDATTGTVISQFDGPGNYADAISFSNDGQSMFILDSSVGYTTSYIWETDLSGNVLNQFTVELDAEGLTILADGTLVVGGGGSGVVAFVDTSSETITSQFSVSNNLYGLSSDGFGNIFGLRIDGIIDTYDLDGTLLGSLATSATGTTLGLAYTGESFFVASTGSTIFEIALDGSLLNSFSGPGPFTEGLDFPEIQVYPEPNGVPEPITMLLLGFGIIGLAELRRKI